MERALVMHSKDNIATAISELKPGEAVSVLIGSERLEVKIRDKVPFGHKFAIKHIDKGGIVFKYGQSIGASTSVINVGQYVHTHNLKGLRGALK